MTINLYLLLLAIPYLSFTSYDLWMHKHDRNVPQIEKILHGITIPSILVFLVFSIMSNTMIASIGLVIAFPCMLADELFYHKHLHIKEKKIHMLAGLSLIIYILAWLWMI